MAPMNISICHRDVPYISCALHIVRSIAYNARHNTLYWCPCAHVFLRERERERENSRVAARALFDSADSNNRCTSVHLHTLCSGTFVPHVHFPIRVLLFFAVHATFYSLFCSSLHIIFFLRMRAWINIIMRKFTRKI